MKIVMGAYHALKIALQTRWPGRMKAQNAPYCITWPDASGVPTVGEFALSTP